MADGVVAEWSGCRVAVGSEHLAWVLKGGVLDGGAGCSGFAICDARFRAGVPKGLTGLRGGS